MNRLRGFLTVISAAVALSACAPATEQAGTGGLARSRTMLVVENNNWLDVAVYVARGGLRTRLGAVSSMSKGEFAIPDAYVLGVADITVLADPVGASNAYTSPPIQVYPGARVELRVANNVRLSDYSVYSTN